MRKLVAVILLGFATGAFGAFEFTGPLYNIGDDWESGDYLLYHDSDFQVYSADDLTTWFSGTSNEINISGTDTLTIGIVNPLIVGKGGTGTESLTDGGLLLGSGTDAVTAMSVLSAGQIAIGDGTTDPTTLSAFTSATGSLKHEYGGLEADVSGYGSGLFGMLSGTTTDIDTLSEIETAIGGSTNILSEAEIDASSELAAIMDDETGTGLLVFATNPSIAGATFTDDVNIDDNDGASPLLSLVDESEEVITLYKTDADVGWLRCDNTLNLASSGDYTDYLQFSTTSDVPQIGTYGSCDLKITASSGTIDFNDEDLTTTGDVTANRHIGASTTWSTEGPTDDVDVSGVEILWLGSVGHNVTIGGFSGGVAGQKLYATIVIAANDVTLEHNEAGGSQNIFLSAGADETISASNGGWLLICDGSDWYECDN